jgi:class 3 adenylate cyclase
MPHWATHVEAIWRDPAFVRFMKRLSAIAEVLLFDKRGVGLSDPLPLLDLPTLESWSEDIETVMDAAGWQDAAILASDAAGPMSMLFAASHPERISALILVNTAAKLRRAADYPAGMPDRAVTAFLKGLESGWGSSVTLDVMNPSVSQDLGSRSAQARYQRQTASPGTMIAMARTLMDVDVRSVLPAISAPTLILHRSENGYYRVAHGRYLAEQIRHAKYVELPGMDHTMTVGDQTRLLDEVEEFLTGARPRPEFERVLATVLFTDIVESTTTAARSGDWRWREMISAHNEVIQTEVARCRGRVIKTTGDGAVATFDGPARAIQAARTIRAALRSLQLDVRAGIHTGEIEIADDDLVGIAVHVAQRVCALAGAGEVWVSSTVVDLVVGSGIDFCDRGEHELRGVPGRRRLFVVAE